MKSGVRASVADQEMEVELAGVERQYGDWGCTSGMVKGRASNSDGEDANCNGGTVGGRRGEG